MHQQAEARTARQESTAHRGAIVRLLTPTPVIIVPRAAVTLVIVRTAALHARLQDPPTIIAQMARF